MRRFSKPKLTDEQERQGAAGEKLLFRSQIIKAGVRESLTLEWPGPYDLDIQVQMLTEALQDQQEGYRLMNIAKHAADARPTKIPARRAQRPGQPMKGANRP